MEDKDILQLFLDRDEKALVEISSKYSAYCKAIAMNIVANEEDAKECVNDTLLRVWKSIPPAYPDNLKAYVAKIVRNLALDVYDRLSAKKRGGGVTEVALSELEDCIPEREIEVLGVEELINDFLETQDPEKRKVFVRRYFYLDSIKDLAKTFGMTESKVKVTLFRMRNELKEILEKEGTKI